MTGGWPRCPDHLDHPDRDHLSSESSQHPEQTQSQGFIKLDLVKQTINQEINCFYYLGGLLFVDCF